MYNRELIFLQDIYLSEKGFDSQPKNRMKIVITAKNRGFFIAFKTYICLDLSFTFDYNDNADRQMSANKISEPEVSALRAWIQKVRQVGTLLGMTEVPLALCVCFRLQAGQCTFVYLPAFFVSVYFPLLQAERKLL